MLKRREARVDHWEMRDRRSDRAPDPAEAFGVGPRPGRSRHIAIVLCSLLVPSLLFGLVVPRLLVRFGRVSSLPSCVAAGIGTSAGLEGHCARGGWLLSPSTVYNVVDRNQVLRMPEYEARLLATDLIATRVDGNVPADEYPDDRAWLASFEIQIHNLRDVPFSFNTTGRGVVLLIPRAVGDTYEPGWSERLNPRDAPGPLLAWQSPIPARGEVRGWVSFLISPSARPMLGVRPSDLDFLRPGISGYIGQIRLWK
jgi:hypothetical protein